MASSIPILTFHSLDDAGSVISFPPSLFERGLESLHDRGYRTLGLIETVNLIREGEGLPERTFVITFDDGYENIYKSAFPVLLNRGMTATVFVTPGSKGSTTRLPELEGRSMLSWDELREMREHGWEIGAHTLSHPDLTRLPDHRVELEVFESKKIIEDRLGCHVTSFAYPFGRYDDRSRSAVERYFDCACSDTLGLATPVSDPYALERVDAYYLRSEKKFDLMASSLFTCYIWARRIPRRIRRLFPASR